MKEAQIIKRNKTRQQWRKANIEKERAQNRLHKKRQRESDKEKYNIQQRKWRLAKKEKEKNKPLGYIVEVDGINLPQFPLLDFKGLSEYEILKLLRLQFNSVLISNIQYSVFKIKQSRFDKVPFDETDS